ncbi:MAG: hypothetical protein AB1331_03920 [Bacillota bacterium]
MARKTVATIIVALMLVLVLAGSAVAAPHRCHPTKLPQVYNTDRGIAILGDVFAKLSPETQDMVGRFLAALNLNTTAWRIDGASGTLEVDDDAMTAALAESDLISGADLKSMIQAFQGMKLAALPKKQAEVALPDVTAASTLLPYWDDVYISSEQHYDEHDSIKTDWLRGPGTVGFSDIWSYNWGFSVSGQEVSTIISWLGVQVGWGYSTSGSYSFPVAAGQDGRAHRIDRHYHTSVTYDEYYYSCDDIPGVYTQYYYGRHTDSSTKFYERVYYCEYRNSI